VEGSNDRREGVISEEEKGQLRIGRRGQPKEEGRVQLG
jgi:hypothetical protein